MDIGSSSWSGATDMRKSFNGLAILASTLLGATLASRGRFVFANHAKTRPRRRRLIGRRAEQLAAGPIEIQPEAEGVIPHHYRTPTPIKAEEAR